ncbi:cation-translocating P-type ATPase [Brooklawnia cerclae]
MHARDLTELITELRTDPAAGLNAAEAARRLADEGPNELRGKPPVPLCRKVLAQFQDPLVYLLLVAIAISVAAWVVEGGHGLPVDAIVIALIVVANAVIGFVQEARAADAVAALSSMTAPNSTVVRDGARVTIPTITIVRGDVLVLAEGDTVGADARLVTAAALRVQEASLTGESEAVDKTEGTLPPDAPLAERTNMVFKDTSVVQGVGRAVVTSTGMGTQMGAIATLLDETEQAPTPLEREIAAVSRMLGLLVIGIAVVVMAVLTVISGARSPEDLVDILLMGVSLAVAAVPEGLPAILTLVLAMGVRVLARHNAVMKDLHSVETLGSASVICSDKTGTLTRNEMTLARVVTPSGELELTGTGYRPEGQARVVDAGRDPDTVLREATGVLLAGSLANDAALNEDDGEWGIQGDPTEAALLVALRKLDGAAEHAEGFTRRAEIPFNSQRKMMSVVHDAGSGLVLFSKGAPDVLLDRCTAVSVDGGEEPLTDAWRRRILGRVEELSGQAYRTLGLARRDVDAGELSSESRMGEEAEHGLTFLGVVAIIDPPREEVTGAIAQAHRAGIRTVMITGDHPATATRIARDLGIVPGGASTALTGNQIDAMTADEFHQATREVSVYARVAPEHKLRIVDALQADGHVVAMTGDGVNDAPALKSADIGIAMGITGTEVTKQAATMILADDNYATIVTAVHQGRIIFDNIRKFLRYLLSSNMGEVATVFLGVVLADALGLTEASPAGGIVVPLLATQILWINLVTDSGPALAMGVDPEMDDVMARPPRDPRDRIIDTAMWTRIIVIGLVMAGCALMAIDVLLPGGLVEGTESLAVARTAAFTTLVFAQLFNALNARSDATSAFHHLFANRWLWGSLALGAVLQVAVVHVPFLQVAFGTAALRPAHWAMALGLASVVLWVDEAIKLVGRLRAS